MGHSAAGLAADAHGRGMGVLAERGWGRGPVGHGERRRELERQFPGWEIWYVPRQPGSATWRARPQMLLDAASPEDLAAAIGAAHGPVIPDPPLPAVPRGDPAGVRRFRELEEPAGAARRTRRPGNGGRFPAGRGRCSWRGRAHR